MTGRLGAAGGGSDAAAEEIARAMDHCSEIILERMGRMGW